VDNDFNLRSSLIGVIQGWRGSTKTWKLIWALRDHLVELVEMEKIANSDAIKKTSRIPIPWANQDSTLSESRRDAAAKKNLPEPWTIEYLQVRRLRNLHRRSLSPPYSHNLLTVFQKFWIRIPLASVLFLK
jgi:hypothetical protein